MERLTNFWGNLTKCESCAENSNCYSHSCNHISESIAKLRDYEDLEEQGELLKLPCAVGDTVFVMSSSRTGHYEEEYEEEYIFIPSGLEIYEEKFDYWMIPHIGKFIFLTQEEAGAAMSKN